MKKAIRLSAIACSVLLAAGVFASCKKNKDNPENLDIYIVDAGYKTDWVYQMKDAFLEQAWVKEKYPTLNITIYANKTQTYVEDVMNAGQASNKFDLMFGMNLGALNGRDDVLDLTEGLYKKEIPGTDVKYIDSITESYRTSFEYYPKSSYSAEPKFYFAPWAGGMYGLVYNKTFFANYGYEVPRTTDELVAICSDFYEKETTKENDKKYCFLQGKDEAYFNSLFDVFWGQYQSVQEYINYFNGVVDNAPSVKIFEQQGRLRALEVYEQLIGREDRDYVSPDSDNLGFMMAQYSFLSGKSLFNVNGDWFVSENKKQLADIKEAASRKGQTYDYEFTMMRTPIISSIIENCPSIESDAELSNLVKAIDAGATSLVGEGYEVSVDDFAIVREARGVVMSQGATHQAIVPSYAMRSDAAVDFLAFMATKEGQNTYLQSTDGASLPFHYDVAAESPELFNSLDALHKDRLTYMNSNLNPYTLPSKYNFPLVKYGGVDAFHMAAGDSYFANMRYISSPGGGKTGGKKALTYYNDTIRYYTENDNKQWKAALSSAGIQFD